MNRETTPLSSTSKKTVNKNSEHPKMLQPSDKSVQKILQYAAMYRVEKLNNQLLVTYCLN